MELIDQSLAVSTELLNDSLEFCRGNVRVEPVAGTFSALLDKHLRLLRMELAAMSVDLTLDASGRPGRGAGRESHGPGACEIWPKTRAKRCVDERARWSPSARNTPEGLDVFVADNGPGIPPEIREKLFQPFSTHGKRGGTGFGLAIAKQLVEAHAGRITVTSSPAGTRFAILLPRRAADASATTQSGAIPDAPARATSSRRFDLARCPVRVLLVDDSAGQPTADRRLCCRRRDIRSRW